MTVFVDDFRCPARVGRIQARWSHLTAATPDELHEFAERIGLRRAWFQSRCKSRTCPSAGGVCVHFHYDVTDNKRLQAIAAGAVSIGVREFGEIVAVRRAVHLAVVRR
ncbi:DUF4031 domain-containing protein [Actinoplanes rectilineatus]|uniref:DUF4031 domain-containing protein n=1 Tax=Actinoplanes rectilineatus TaxID=113571 RepID=UPI0005F2F6D4|nr:DUF4031 domain-containing protein [Actinoplanes rectilineatus]